MPLYDPDEEERKSLKEQQKILDEHIKILYEKYLLDKERKAKASKPV